MKSLFHRKLHMENNFSPSIPHTLGYSATSKSTDSFTGNFIGKLHFQAFVHVHVCLWRCIFLETSVCN